MATRRGGAGKNEATEKAGEEREDNDDGGENKVVYR